MKSLLRLFFALALCSFGSRAHAWNTIDEVVHDMQWNHEATLHGVPSWYDWATKPKTSKVGAQSKAKAIVFWNQVYEPDTLNRAWWARVQIRNVRVYVLYNDNKWYLIQSSGTVNSGAMYRENFANNENRPWDATWSSEGYLQVKSGSQSTAGTGFNFHGYLNWRAGINGSTMRGVFSTCEARLVDDPYGRYLMGVGADLYTSTSGGSNLYDVGIGRHKWVTSDWRSFNMHNLSEQQIRSNPPPLNQ